MNENLKHILRLDIKHPIDYWHKYWNYAVGELEKADSLKILLRTPRIVLTDLLEEVSNDGIWIKENIELFQKELSNWKKDDKAFNIVFGKDLSQLLRNLKFKDKKPLLKQQCMVMLQKMDKGQYFDNLVTQIETIVEADSQITYELKDEINKLTISMITELLSKGYPVEDLKGMSDGVPEVIFAEGHIVMGAPTVCCDLKRDDYTNEESYYLALTDKIKGRSPKEVVEGLKEYYYHKPGVGHDTLLLEDTFSHLLQFRFLPLLFLILGLLPQIDEHILLLVPSEFHQGNIKRTSVADLHRLYHREVANLIFFYRQDTR